MDRRLPNDPCVANGCEQHAEDWSRYIWREHERMWIVVFDGAWFAGYSTRKLARSVMGELKRKAPK